MVVSSIVCGHAASGASFEVWTGPDAAAVAATHDRSGRPTPEGWARVAAARTSASGREECTYQLDPPVRIPAGAVQVSAAVRREHAEFFGLVLQDVLSRPYGWGGWGIGQPVVVCPAQFQLLKFASARPPFFSCFSSLQGFYVFANDSDGMRYSQLSSDRERTPTAEDANILVSPGSSGNNNKWNFFDNWGKRDFVGKIVYALAGKRGKKKSAAGGGGEGAGDEDAGESGVFWYDGSDGSLLLGRRRHRFGPAFKVPSWTRLGLSFSPRLSL